MSDLTSFKHGGVTYPLTSSTANSLLRDADPALYYAIQLFESVLDTYVFPRLSAQGKLEDLRFPSAVEKSIHFEPTPFLLSDQLVFPLFCLWRSEEGWDEHTVAHEKDTSLWEWAWILPAMTPRQIEQIHPILRSVAVVVRTFAKNSWDPAFSSGQTLRDLSGIMKMVPGPVKYGNFEAIENESKWWRAVHGRLVVQERGDIDVAATEAFAGANINLDAEALDETVVADLVQAKTYGPPSIASIAPATGTKAGGTAVTVTGTGFRTGVPYRLLIGGAYAASVVATSTTTLTAFTPSHEAYDTFGADVLVLDPDGQESNTLSAAFTFTTP